LRLAPDPPCPSVLPPGAGNEEAKKAIKTDEKRANEAKERAVLEPGVDRQLDAPTVRRDDDGDVATIPAIEQTQAGLQNVARRTRAVAAVYEALRDRATSEPRADRSRVCARRRNDRVGIGARCACQSIALADACWGIGETAGTPAVSQSPKGSLQERVHRQRCPASRTSAELATADSMRRTRKA
jgi:hypothetical protein